MKCFILFFHNDEFESLISNFMCWFLLSLQEDVFTLKAIDLGKLIKLKIYHDNKGGNAAWFLNSVEVINMKSKER